jgi:hypothetical protein
MTTTGATRFPAAVFCTGQDYAAPNLHLSLYTDYLGHFDPDEVKM